MAINHKSVTEQTGTYTFTWACPAGVYALLNWVHVIYTASADAGTRQVKIIIKDSSGNMVLDVHAGATFVATNVRHFLFCKGVYRETSFVDDQLQVPMPHDLIIEPGWTLTVADVSGTDSATDAMAIDFQYKDVNP